MGAGSKRLSALHGADFFHATVKPLNLLLIQDAKCVAIVGSRKYPELERVRALVELLNTKYPAVVISGGAEGVDTMADKCAAERDLPTVCVRPGVFNLRRGKLSYLERNSVIVRGADIVVAFWDGRSSGTKDAIEKALTIRNRVVAVLPGKAPEIWERYVVPKR